MSYTSSGKVSILTLGNPLQANQTSSGGNCRSQSIVPSRYSGYMDEFRVYSRELTAADIYELADP